MKCINNDKDHIRVLYELGILDYDEDWELFCKMQAEELYIDTATWLKYCRVHPYCISSRRTVESRFTKFQLNDLLKDGSAERLAGK